MTTPDSVEILLREASAEASIACLMWKNGEKEEAMKRMQSAAQSVLVALAEADSKFSG